MKVGICGFPGSGKSTVFQALSPGASSGAIARGNIKVPDPRVDQLAAIFHPKKTTYAQVGFVDMGGAHGKGKAFSPEVVQEMRNADLLVHVVRGFENPMLSEGPDIERDVAHFHDEVILTDQAVLETIAQRWKKENKKEVAVVERCVKALEDGRPLREIDLSEEDRTALQGIQLISTKPLVTLYNLAEGDWADSKYRAATERSFGLCGVLEAEIAAMPEAEQKDFLEGLGMGEPARYGFIRLAYGTLDLISFLTAGEDECRAWTVRRGSAARKAAGVIHSDIERGFIRAEVYRVDDLVALGSEAALKSAGKLRVEGKDYVVQDGDVMHFRFNV